MPIGQSEMRNLPIPIVQGTRIASRSGVLMPGHRSIAEETAVAFTYNGSCHAVMMATPADLEDFALGLSLTEEIVESPDDISELDIVNFESGVELRMWLSQADTRLYSARRRRLAGPTGCGLCGIESLSEVARCSPRVENGLEMTPSAVSAAMAELPKLQTMNQATRSVHAAAFYQPDIGIVAIREDVGRHNALDKLVGALARRHIQGSSGVVLLTSRISVELVQKTAILGASILVAVSAPTALAIRVAEACNISLVAIARDKDFEIFTHPHRISAEGRRLSPVRPWHERESRRSTAASR
jgi:FdhD protein